MTPHALNGPLQRVVRAEEHLADLRTRIPAITDEQMSAFIIKFDEKPPHSLKIVIKGSKLGAPMSMGVLIGEICYNLRSALDYFIFEFARHDSGSIQSGTQFPIEDNPKGFAWRQKRGWLAGIDAAHVAAIERLQPYNRCDWTSALRDLSNRDRHREFAEVGGTYATHVFTPVTDANFNQIQLPITRAPHPIVGEMDVKIHAVLTIRFADGTPIVETLEKIKTALPRHLLISSRSSSGESGGAHCAPALRRPVFGTLHLASPMSKG